MSLWTFLVYAAWIVSAGIAVWMLFDVLAVGRAYSEDFLTSAREGQE